MGDRHPAFASGLKCEYARLTVDVVQGLPRKEHTSAITRYCTCSYLQPFLFCSLMEGNVSDSEVPPMYDLMAVQRI